MSNDLSKLSKEKSSSASEVVPPRPETRSNPEPQTAGKGGAGVTAKVAPLFRRIDWLAFWMTTLLTLIGYYWTLAPDLTLEDSGELAVGSFYAGVPHPPGYPVWTIYTWLFTVLVPVSNIAWRVALSSAVASAFSCGLIALMVSRGSSMLLEGIEGLKQIEKRWENLICLLAGYVGGMLFGFNGFVWSQAVIVEVYTLSVLSLTITLALLLRWLYAPEQRRYLYWAFFVFGICFTNHQTLLVCAMGMEVLIMMAAPKLGRDMFLGNSIIYIAVLILKYNGYAGSLTNNASLFVIFNIVGIGSIGAFVYLWSQTRKMFTELKPVVISAVCWLLGASFYFYMPLASMTNPPMNWGYPRHFDGFVHALTRGQYEKANPTDDPLKFLGQIRMYGEGAVEEFGAVYLLIGLLPFLFFYRMQKRERAWIVGLSAIYLCLAVLLLILLNPGTDRQSRDLNRVFFTSSHVIIAMGMGYGLALIGALIATQYDRFRPWLVRGGAIGAGLGLYYVVKAFEDTQYYLLHYAAMVGLIVPAVFLALVLVFRQRFPMAVYLALLALIPAQSIMSHWSDNEQRGHMFGYWFGHDMFEPPFNGPDNQPIYPEMAKNAVLFGGTDPGRFNPTYMIFCESFIPPEKKFDPTFDRRDVYLITQNALADGTYLDYIRAHYNRSTQKDPHFFQGMLRWKKDIQRGTTNIFARMALPLDLYFTKLGAQIEERRRKEGVYPPKEINTPSVQESQVAFEGYIQDATRRLQLNQLKPGEEVNATPDGRVQVSGQVAVMAINGLLTKVIFDRNPDHEFYVEESFPLDWMYPYLTPFGIIMKINRQPLPELTQEIIDKDHIFWRKYSERLIGDWITYDTPVKEICEFAKQVYLRRDFTGYKGDMKFVRDDNAQKAFSKLRSSIAGVYNWRINASRSPQEQQRMLKEADFAFRQALAYCPSSPEAIFRYVNLLVSTGRIDDALLIAETAYEFDDENPAITSLIAQLGEMKARQGTINQLQNQLPQLEAQLKADPTNGQLAFNLVSAYLAVQNTNSALEVLDSLVANAKVDNQVLLSVAQAYVQLGHPARLEPVFMRLTRAMPTNAEAWYDLAAIQATINKLPQAVESLAKAIQVSNERMAQQPGAANLSVKAQSDPRFAPLRALPQYQQIFAPK